MLNRVTKISDFTLTFDEHSFGEETTVKNTRTGEAFNIQLYLTDNKTFKVHSKEYYRGTTERCNIGDEFEEVKL